MCANSHANISATYTMTDQLRQMRVACGHRTEFLFVEAVDSNRYVVRSIPYLANGIALRDTVKTTPTDDGPAFASVSTRSGLYTVRAQFYPHIGLESALGREFLGGLDSLGHDYEVLPDEQLIAIAVASGDVYIRLAGRLSRMSSICIWETAHPHTGEESALRPPNSDVVRHERPAPMSAVAGC